MNNTIDENLTVLKSRLDPMLEAANSNYKKVKNKNGFEKMWLPLFFIYPFKQLVSLFTFGKFGMKVSKVQGITTSIIAIAPFASNFIAATEQYIQQFTKIELCSFALGLWYLFTVIYTFLQMPNWKNEDLFHIDAYRIFRANEYKIVEPFLGTNFSIESINNFMLRNSNERAIREIKELSESEVSRLEAELDQVDAELYDYEQNLIFLNNILIHLNDNITHISNLNLGFEHLYIMNAPYCVYEVKDDIFDLKYKEVPRRRFPTGFAAQAPEFSEEIFVKCYLGDKDYYDSNDAYAYKIFLDKLDVYWIITFYPSKDDEYTLQALLQDSIIKEENELLRTANLRDLLEAHCKIISEKQKIVS
ncbi:hypothetical protein COJ92_27630 [Priestia megaterium]|uniref:hypothetical protein n=1 Tax=Priestia megaterium TaxID=1404 RepID=UPI000BF35E1C|nr:hypothetical protein [Priestia megaterium]PFP10142.1 hypothetical protein COJ92_27630 [Priestia megaterium]